MENQDVQATLAKAMEASKRVIEELKTARKSLVHSGMDIKEVNNTIRKAHAEASQVEVIDLNNPNLPQNLEEYVPDEYAVTELLSIPHGEAVQAIVKKEPELDQELPVQKGWYRRQANSGSHDDPLMDNSTSLSLFPDAQRMVNTQGDPIPQVEDTSKKRKLRKPPKSAEFVTMSDASFFSAEPHKDSDPAASVQTFKLFMMKEDRKSAFIAEVSQLDPEKGGIIFSDRYDDEAKKERKQLVTRVRRCLNDTDLSAGSQHMTKILEMMVQNPESFFRVIALTSTLHKAGNEPNEVASRIIFDEEEGKAIIIDPAENVENTCTEDPSTSSIADTFDSRLSNNSLTSSFVTYVREVTPAMTQYTSTPSLLESAGFSFAASPIAAYQPTQPFKRLRNELSHDSRNSNLIQLVGNQSSQGQQSTSKMDEKQHRALHANADKVIQAIRRFPYPKRLPINQWKSLIRNGSINAPLPIDYHPRYRARPTFLTGSFCQEPWPGVFRPCTSAWTEHKAMQEFTKEHDRGPHTIKELNMWIKVKFKPVTPEFDPKYPIEIPEYSLEFFGEVGAYNLAREGASVNTQGAAAHSPRNLITAKRFLSLHDLSFMEPFMADPLLCTLGPAPAARGDYIGYSVPVPNQGGDLVVTNALFEHNSLSYPIINGRTLIGRCGVCSGLLCLPDYITFLAFFWPDGLKYEQVTPAIKEVWDSQKIPVCWIHLLTDGRYVPNRKI